MKQLLVFDWDKPDEVVWKGLFRYFGLSLALLIATMAAVMVLMNMGWMEPNSWPVFVAFTPLLIVGLAGGVFATAPAVVGLFVAFRLPAPPPLAERNLLFASAGWVVRVFWGTAMLVTGGIIGGFIAQNLDSVAELAEQATVPAEGDPQLSEEAAAVLTSFVDIVFWWTGLAVALALLAAGIAVITLSVRVLHAGREARFRALTPKTEPLKLPTARRLAWRHHFSHWGYGVYLLGFLWLFGGAIAAAVIMPLVLAHQAVNDLIQSFAV